MSNFAAIEKHFIVNSYPYRGLTLVKGDGVHLYDDSGNEYLDCLTNYGVSIFGYNHPTITAALVSQLKTLPSLHGSFVSDVRAEAAKKLVNMAGGNLAQVYFSSSGAEAVEAAIKFAWRHTGKTKIISTRGGYHGKTLGSLSATSEAKYRRNLEDKLVKFNFVPFGDLDALKKELTSSVAAVILEPIQGESGIIVPPPGYLAAAAKLTKKMGCLLIIDEIQTGLGRTGSFLASGQEEIKPDIVCLGKGLAGGIPVGATLVTKDIAAGIPKSWQTSTFGGNPLAAAGILATLDLLTAKQLKQNEQTGSWFIEQLSAINHPRIVSVRGRGFMVGVEVAGNRNQVLKNLQRQGVLAGPAGDQVVRFLPPYIITKTQLRIVVKKLIRSL
jgi:acetylornithine/LysW-gamma-L-lysine aminotransferase